MTFPAVPSVGWPVATGAEASGEMAGVPAGPADALAPALDVGRGEPDDPGAGVDAPAVGDGTDEAGGVGTGASSSGASSTPALGTLTPFAVTYR